MSKAHKCGRITSPVRQISGFNVTHKLQIRFFIFSAMVVVVGKGELLSADENWNALIEGCKEHGTYVSTKPE